MKCPQCGVETPDDEWNCASCRVNLYWAKAHYDELARIRAEQGLASRAASPQFLVDVSKRELAVRNGRGYAAMNKVRQIARRVIRGEATEAP